MKEKQLKIWQLILNDLRNRVDVVLIYVVNSNGSSPGRQGYFMAVNATGDMMGSIGGGIMEHKFVEMAKEQMRSNAKQLQLRLQVHDKTASKNQSGMICSGEQTIFIYPCIHENIKTIENIIITLEQNKNATLLLSNNGINFLETIPAVNFSYHYQNDSNWYFNEKIGFKNKLFIIGGGHCSLALCKLMSTMDFHITVIEDREELNTVIQNKFTHHSIFINDYSEIKTYIDEGENCYVVIMTFGYRTDDIVLRKLINYKFKYIGLLGSKIKIEKMFVQYREEGISNEKLNSIFSPIGIQIKSETPEEIAISIAAEIISIKNLKCLSENGY